MKFKLLLILVLSFTTNLFSQSDSSTVEIFDQNAIHFGGNLLNDTLEVQEKDNGRIISKLVELPNYDVPVKIIAHLDIKSTISNNCSSGGDPWDRAGNVSLAVPGMKNIEILKFITGFGGHSVLQQDISDLAPLLRGDCRIEGFVDTWVSPAWKMDFKLIYYIAPQDTNALWNYGVLYKPVLKSTDVTLNEPTYEVNIPPGETRVMLTYYTSGHCTDGQGADEFVSKDNVIYIDNQEVHRYRPWRTDCQKFRSRNPCSGRWGSTWSSDLNRSGWCPGDIVYPVRLDFSDYLTPGKHTIQYAVENIRPQDNSGLGYWRVSSYLTGWGDVSTWAAEKIDLTGPEKQLIPTDTPVAFRIDLVDGAGFPVFMAQAKLEISSDSTGPVFSMDRDEWANPLTIDVEHGSAQFWMQSEIAGNFTVQVSDVSPSPTLAPADGITITVNDFEVGEDEFNLALTATASADCECNPATESAQHAIDGNLSTKWCCDNAAPDWLLVTLADTTDLNYFIIRHAGAGQAHEGDPGFGDGPGMNTETFDIQIKDTSGSWQNVVSVDGNPGTVEGNITYHPLETPVRTNQVRLKAIKPAISRIYEFEMYLRDLTTISDYNYDMEAEPLFPETFQLFQNYPNPFNNNTRIEFYLPEYAEIQATVMNSRGQLVANLASGHLPRGMHTLEWNATNANNQQIATGIYFINIKFVSLAGTKFNLIKKMVYTR